MTLRLYNTLTRTKEDFKPLDENNVRMYVCGPTVYDYAHIGNARPVIVFDVLYRLLRHLYGEQHVTYVRNLTDVDDKINARALRDYPDLALNDAIRRVTEKTANQFQSDAKALGCLTPTHEPRATDHIQGMIDMISTLITKGHAYVAAGEVLFAVDAMKDYGKLSGRKLEDQQAGARIAVEAHKKNPADFVLWKLSSAEEPGWDSPWGRGRPGWHIECSAMSEKYLGETFDIHGGGLDLIFPHHENEIAQSRCAHGTTVMANYWMHNGFLQVEGKKMSKSDGNFVTIADVLNYTPGQVARLAMLKTHYRQPLDWTAQNIRAADNDLSAWSKELTTEKFWALKNYQNPYEFQNWSEFEMPKAVADLLSDDLNFSELVKQFHEWTEQSRKGNEESRLQLAFGLSSLGLVSRNTIGCLARVIKWSENVLPSAELSVDVNDYRVNVANNNLSTALAIFNKNHERGVTVEHNDKGEISIDTEDGGAELIDALVAARLVARHTKNWAESDRIRDELAAMGIAIKDNKDGTTTWEVKR